MRHSQKQLKFYKDQWAQLQQEQGPNIMLAYDGMIFDMDKLIPRSQLLSGHTKA